MLAKHSTRCLLLQMFTKNPFIKVTKWQQLAVYSTLSKLAYRPAFMNIHSRRLHALVCLHSHVISIVWDSIAPTHRDDLHWLPVRQRVDFEICLVVVVVVEPSVPGAAWTTSPAMVPDRRSVYSTTNAHTSSLHRTSCHCSLQWWQSQPVDICGPLILVIWPHRGQELWAGSSLNW